MKKENKCKKEIEIHYICQALSGDTMKDCEYYEKFDNGYCKHYWMPECFCEKANQKSESFIKRIINYLIKFIKKERK